MSQGRMDMLVVGTILGLCWVMTAMAVLFCGESVKLFVFPTLFTWIAIVGWRVWD